VVCVFVSVCLDVFCLHTWADASTTPFDALFLTLYFIQVYVLELVLQVCVFAGEREREIAHAVSTARWSTRIRMPMRMLECQRKNVVSTSLHTFRACANVSSSPSPAPLASLREYVPDPSDAMESHTITSKKVMGHVYFRILKLRAIV